STRRGGKTTGNLTRHGSWSPHSLTEAPLSHRAQPRFPTRIETKIYSQFLCKDIARREFMSPHSDRQVCGLTVFDFSSTKLKSLDRAIRFPMQGHVTKQEHVAQGAEPPVLRVNHPDINKKHILHRPRQQRPDGLHPIKQHAGHIGFKSQWRFNVPIPQYFFRCHQPIIPYQIQDQLRWMKADGFGSPICWKMGLVFVAHRHQPRPGILTAYLEKTI